jgi:hypothetical protein
LADVHIPWAKLILIFNVWTRSFWRQAKDQKEEPRKEEEGTQQALSYAKVNSLIRHMTQNLASADQQICI